MKLALKNWIIFIPLFIALLMGDVLAADSVSVTTTGEASIANLTPEQAQGLALKRARLKAIEKVCGVVLQAETFVQNNVLQGDFIHSVSYGNIISEEIIRWDAEVFQKSKKRPPELTYKVTLKADVLKEQGEPDPFYRVDVLLNKKVYQSGDEMIIKVSATKPSYLSVLNFSADGSVVLLFPNEIRKNNKIEGGKEYQIPSAADRKDILKLQVSTLPGHKRDTEFIKVIATREPIYLLDMLSVRGKYGVMETAQLAVTELARLISSIPVKDRAEATATYEIVSSN